MISTLEKEITFRFLKARKKDGFLNVISIFSFIGISLGVAVLIIVMSVMNGFRSELINKIVGFNAHITVDTYENQIQIDKLKNTNLNLIASEMILSNSGEAIIIKKDTSKGIILRGYSRKDFPKLKIIKDKTFVGNKSNLTGNYISLGKELSFTLNLKLGDDVSIMSSSGVDTIIGSIPKKKSFTIVSLFESGLADFDNNVAFINIDTLDEFMNLSKKDRKLEVYLKDPQNIAAFNIISGLTILVKNKTRDIAILKSIGVLNKSIIKIFFLVGVTIGTSATLFGIILGVTFSMYVENVRKFLSDVFNISLFPEEIYFLSTMPSEINPSSIFIISLCSIFVTIIVSIFPAMRAAKLDPIKALKYE